MGPSGGEVLENKSMQTIDEIAGTIAQAIEAAAPGPGRLMVALVGPPGAGKSTIGARVCERLFEDGRACALVPMDGFHLDNAILDARGQRSRKGAPFTFDADGFVSMIARMAAADAPVIYPLFDRSRDLAIAGAAELRTDVDIVIVEGNYLLLKEAPWDALRGHFALSVMLKPDEAILRQRLEQRWLDHGLEPDAARERAALNDLPNALYVLANSRDADLVIES